MGMRGARCERVVSLTDLFPTLIDLCFLSEAKTLDGTSLAPLLENPCLSWERPAVTSHPDRGHFAVRTERWRYIRYRDGSEELYDHDVDPNEWHNLAGSSEYAKQLAELRKEIPMAPAPAAPGKSAYHFDPVSYSWSFI